VEKISVTAVLDENDKPLDPGFDRVFREYYAFVYRTAYGITGRAEDAEDVAQTIFLRLIRREFPPDLRKSPKAYLYRAAFNQSVSVIRKRRRHRATADDGEALAVPAVAPADPRSGEELTQRLYAAIEQLTPQSAQILILRYVHNCGLTEIAKIVGSTRGTVAVSLFRSRARLKKLVRTSREEKS
jgi:RNA polymerase sigma-70 factor (ECF subfamily)